MRIKKMGTSCIIKVSENPKESIKPLMKIYKKYDGYPVGIGNEILSCLNNGDVKIINGYGSNQNTPKYFNGMGCLSAHLVGCLKSDIGDVYIQSINEEDDLDCDYKYTIYQEESDKSKLNIRVHRARWSSVPGDLLYDGSLCDFCPEELI
jgi:hypothetical protein